MSEVCRVAARRTVRMQAWYDTYTMRQRAGEIDVKPSSPPGP